MPVMSRSFAMMQAIQYEMQQNKFTVFSRQNSVGSASRPDGKSINLLSEFGLDRVLARGGQAIDEDWMANSTVGYAMAGGLSGASAVVELPSMTTLFPAEFVFNQMSQWHHMSAGLMEVPMVLILGGAGRRPGAGQQHAHAGQEGIYANMAGVKVVSPHKVYDIKGLMHSAIRERNPVIFFNYSTEASADIPDEPYMVPIGKAQILKEGKDLTIAALPPSTLEVEKAVDELTKGGEGGGLDAEIFDPRTLKPFDEATLVASVKKTGNLLVVTQGHYTNSFGSHIIAVAAQEVPGAKFRLIAFPDATPPGSGPMVTWMIPDATKIVDAARKLVRI